MQPLMRTRGFTLIELMVTIAILAILMTIAVPSFMDTIRNNRVASYTNEFTSSLTLARAEASKRGLPVTICASNADQTDCVAGTNWSNGWLIFTDPAGAGKIAADGSELVIDRSRGLSGNIGLNSTNDTYVRFAGNGSPNIVAGTEIEFTVKGATCTDKNLRRIRINPTGRISVRKEACS